MSNQYVVDKKIKELKNENNFKWHDTAKVGYEVSVTSPDFFLTLIGETCNLASELPAITNRLKKELDIWLYEINASMPELKTNKKNKI